MKARPALRSDARSPWTFQSTRVFPGLRVGGARFAAVLLTALVNGCTSGPRCSEASRPQTQRAFGLKARPRGFNLLEKFNVGTQQPFREEDFRLIASLGFNFVRLPMDYRCWIVDEDWLQFSEQVLKEIDDAVAYGQRYGLHVCINFHRAPGYTVAQPPEERSLWFDVDALETCALHWAVFARRYRGVPPQDLSFNLLNEPFGIDTATHARVVRRLADAIQAQDPNRPLVIDGLEWGRTPCPELLDLQAVQSTRGYEPFRLTHYHADWVEGSSGWPIPVWPWPQATGILYGPGRPHLSRDLELTGAFPAGTRLGLWVTEVSDAAQLQVHSRGRVLLDRLFAPGPGEGEWVEENYVAAWDIYQNRYDLRLEVVLPERSDRVRLVNTRGDWLVLGAISLEAPGDKQPRRLPLTTTWGLPPTPIRVCLAGDPALTFHTRDALDQDALHTSMEPWLALEQQGGRVFVGEFGVFNCTPHDVTLRWMRDCLENWQQAGWGWALWNFRGPFGILDSGRKDVRYEAFEGHQLDRGMLELLQAY